MYFLYSILSVLFLSGIRSHEILEGCEYDNLNSMYNCYEITRVFPNQFYGNYNLRCLKCNIQKFTEKTFPFNNELESFNVSHSKIQTISIKAFSKFTTTQFIYLNHNEIKDIAEDAFAGPKQLYELHLQYNNLRKLRPKFLNNLGTNSIDLSHNQLVEILDRTFEGVIGVLVLDLSNNKIEELHRFAFENLEALEVLDLQHNKICHLSLGVLSSLRRLKTLNLSNNKLSSFSLGTFSGLKSLTELNVSNNSLPYFDGDFLLSLPNLQTLDVSGNSIYYFDGFLIPSNSPSLRLLKMDHNIFSCSALKSIVQQLRKANIEIISSTESYDVQNIFGIACVQGEINKNVSYKKFYALALEEASKSSRRMC